MSQPLPPEIKLDPDWQELRLPFNIGSGRSLYTGLEQANRLRLRVFRRKSDNVLVGRVWFGEGADGPPGHAHGGAIAYVLDEAMGSVGWMNDYPVVAAKLEFKYFRMTPLHVDLHVEARIKSETAKRLEIEATLTMPDGQKCVMASAEFAVLTKTKAVGFMNPVADPQGFFQNPKLKWAPDAN